MFGAIHRKTQPTDMPIDQPRKSQVDLTTIRTEKKLRGLAAKKFEDKVVVWYEQTVTSV